MKFYKIKSYAKINISLKVLWKLKSNLHKIESLVSFINLYDEIFVKKINNKDHKIIFYGKFSKGISKNNTIFSLLKILDKKLYGQKYLIKVNKKIPQKSGMGGGSMNASSLLKFLIKSQKLNLSTQEISKISSKIGSDVIIGMQRRFHIFDSAYERSKRAARRPATISQRTPISMFKMVMLATMTNTQ